MLDLTHLRSFVCVAEELHFGRAAERLGMTQPPLSRQIQLLEAGLRVTLLDRSRHAVALTPAGRAFLPEAKALLAASERAGQVARRAMQTGTGSVLRVGFFSATTYAYLPRLIAQARQELPDTDFVLREMNGVTQLEELRTGRLDIGLLRPGPGLSALANLRVFRGRLALAVPHGHPLGARPRLRLRDLHGVPFIGYSEEGPYMQELQAALFAEARVQPQWVQSAAHAQTILSLVSAGMGVALVPEEARNATFANVAFCAIAIPDAPAIELNAAWKPDNANPALAPMLALMERLDAWSA
ncbi:LysR family transcriptional regulator [Rhodovarius crocodyli]|uniref:LysR family transcriptional regulator n=2 Tax=Rhodovarius crocodyli TaxID=1979269 RepID=A0A437MHL2_9PROT|nr:LysR family transcriptional regulator [Rhodovarius crocodyli]